DPRWPYPESKVRAEKAILEQRGDIPVVMLRIAGVYNDDCQSIPIGNQIARIDERQLSSHFFPGDAGHGQSFIHLEDLTDAIARTVERRAELPQHAVILLGEPEVLPYGELQEKIARSLFGTRWSTSH